MPRLSIAKLMAVVAILAVDLAALARTLPVIPNPGLVIMVVILQVGLFRMVSRSGSKRAFWIGFEAFGWAYVLACIAFSRLSWSVARSLFERFVLGTAISRPSEMSHYILFAGVLQLVLSSAVAFLGGLLFYRIARTNDGQVSSSLRPRF